MATAKKKATPATKRRRKGVRIQATTLGATELPIVDLSAELKPLADAVAADGGAVIGAYREPLGGHALLLVSVPIELVAPTPSSATCPTRTFASWCAPWTRRVASSIP